MDIIEYTERLLNIKLSNYQKEILKRCSELPENAKLAVFMMPSWRIICMPKEGDDKL